MTIVDVKPKCIIANCKRDSAQLIRAVVHHHPSNGCKWDTENKNHCVYLICSYHLVLSEAKTK